METTFALVDCENFYVSCERAFCPALQDRPVVVLSNNDGCIVARSGAIKESGIPMGAPYFEWRDQLEAMNAAVLSSNYALYGDISRRVTSILEEEALAVERYSIDECFLALPALDRDALHRLGTRLRRRVRQWIGIPIRVGIGPTKTLAKIADENAKARKRADLGDGVYVCPDEPERRALLDCIPVGDIWGIGSAYETLLHEKGVDTAAEFRELPDPWIRSEMTVVGLRTARELRGHPCLDLELVRPDRHTLIRSRSFGTRVESQDALMEALVNHTERATEKLRSEDLVAKGIRVFITTKRFGPPPHYSNEMAGTLRAYTARAAPFVRAARRLLGPIYRDYVGYKKCGVCLYDLHPARPHQTSLFGRERTKDERLMAAVDRVNDRYGSDTLHLAAAGTPDERDWAMKRQRRSPRYTTRWDELPVATA